MEHTRFLYMARTHTHSHLTGEGCVSFAPRKATFSLCVLFRILMNKEILTGQNMWNCYYEYVCVCIHAYVCVSVYIRVCKRTSRFFVLFFFYIFICTRNLTLSDHFVRNEKLGPIFSQVKLYFLVLSWYLIDGSPDEYIK